MRPRPADSPAIGTRPHAAQHLSGSASSSGRDAREIQIRRGARALTPARIDACQPCQGLMDILLLKSRKQIPEFAASMIRTGKKGLSGRDPWCPLLTIRLLLSIKAIESIN